MSKKKQTDWTLQHHDGVSEKTMIGRPVEVPPPSIDQVHDLEISVWVDGKLKSHIAEKEHAHYLDDGVPYVYDGRAKVVKLLRGLADSIEADVPTQDDIAEWHPTPRLLSCVQQWPGCAEGDYNPACCRFPKSCSCTVYNDGIDPALLEGNQ
jgi:hypothetical protein